MAAHRPLVRIGGRFRQLPVGDTIIMAPRIWAAGASYAQGETVTSPLDWEDYRRIAGTGTDTVDPADDVTKYRAVSFRRVVALPVPNVAAAFTYSVPAVINTAALTLGASARSNVLGVTGKGYLTNLVVVPTTTMPIGSRFEMEIDGRSVLNFTNTAAIGANQGFLLYGLGSMNNVAGGEGNPLDFKRSLQVYVTSAAAASVNATLYHRVVSQG